MVDFQLKPGIKSAFRKAVDVNAIASCRDEPGCRRFDVIDARGEADRILLYEIYDDREEPSSAHAHAALRSISTRKLRRWWRRRRSSQALSSAKAHANVKSGSITWLTRALKAMTRTRDAEIRQLHRRIRNARHRPHDEESAGCDFAFFDLEHSGFGFETVKSAMRYFEAADVAAIVRVPSQEYHHIARAWISAPKA